MAKVIKGVDGTHHLRGKEGTLCGEMAADGAGVEDGILACKHCAEIALAAVELVTKAEKREWRKL